MSNSSCHLDQPERSTPRRPAFAAATFGLVLMLGSFTTAVAQDSSPEASPESDVAAACLVDGGTDAAATPVDATASEVTDPAVIDEATAALDDYYTCANDQLGDVAFGLSFETPSILTVSDPGDGSYAAEHQVMLGSQLIQAIAIISDGGVTSIASTAVDIPGDSATLTVAFGGDDPAAFIPETTEVRPSLIFQTTNAGSEEVSLLALQVPEDFDPASITGTDLPDGVTAIGVYQVQPGEISGAVFQDLQAGTFALVSDGGEVATVTVTEPADLDVPNVVGTPEATPED